jgi:hypothetical protein
MRTFLASCAHKGAQSCRAKKAITPAPIPAANFFGIRILFRSADDLTPLTISSRRKNCQCHLSDKGNPLYGRRSRELTYGLKKDKGRALGRDPVA